MTKALTGIRVVEAATLFSAGSLLIESALGLEAALTIATHGSLGFLSW
ncbi:MAG: hypothetical protein H0U07_04410 [Actinobacteria bacterium]|nr:hypothetical protein [Actinomycetota bacterium]